MIIITPSITSDEDLVRIGEANHGYRVEREKDGSITMSPTQTKIGPKSNEASGAALAVCKDGRQQILRLEHGICHWSQQESAFAGSLLE